MWYLKAGIRTRMNPLGHTIWYGEYGQKKDLMSGGAFEATALTPAGAPDLNTGIDSSKLKQYGLGVVQEIDAAAMSVWLAWRHYEADIDFRDGTSANTEDLDIVKAGALINF